MIKSFFSHYQNYTDIRQNLWDISKKILNSIRWVKSVRIRSFSGWYLVRMLENTDQKKLRIRALFTQWLSISVTVYELKYFKMETNKLALEKS